MRLGSGRTLTVAGRAAEQSPMPVRAARTARFPHAGAIAIALIAAFALLLGAATSASASQPGKAENAQERKSAKKAAAQKKGANKKAAKKHGRQRAKGSQARAHRKQKQKPRRHGAQRRNTKRISAGRLSNNTAVGKPRKKVQAPTAAASGILDAGFESGLFNWNTAGVGDVIPAVSTDIVRTGAFAGDFTLSGGQSRSELILGGNGNGSANNAIHFNEGDEAFYAFSFYIESMMYGRPGAHNLILQFKGDDDGSPNLGLQLWDYEGDDGQSGGRGLWSHSDAMDGDRFLAPAAEGQWHDVLIHFRTSAAGAGFYAIYLNGALIDARNGVSIIPPGANYVYLKNGLYRNGNSIPGTSELRIDASKLGPTAASVVPV